jgi:hypothetical protein
MGGIGQEKIKMREWLPRGRKNPDASIEAFLIADGGRTK